MGLSHGVGLQLGALIKVWITERRRVVAEQIVGYGVVLTATWLLPFALIPGTWEADQVPNVNTDPQPPPYASS